jgi:N-acetylmuramoyl-L-alanine amidase
MWESAATIGRAVVVAAAGFGLAALVAGCGRSEDAAASAERANGGRTTRSTAEAGPPVSAEAEVAAGAGVPVPGVGGEPAGSATRVPAGTVVVLDPGHNGGNATQPEVINEPVDAGGFEKPCNTTGTATDDGYTESAFNLAVAEQLRDRLTAAGADVVMTRTDDTGVGPCIDERGQMAARAGADALVSIHADGAPTGAAGFHVIHPALREGYTDATAGPSEDLAIAVRDALVTAGFTPSTYAGEDGLHQRDDLGTLNRAEVPAVMLEAGNLRDPVEADLLSSPGGQARLADALATAVLAFLQP